MLSGLVVRNAATAGYSRRTPVINQEDVNSCKTSYHVICSGFNIISTSSERFLNSAINSLNRQEGRITDGGPCANAWNGATFFGA